MLIIRDFTVKAGAEDSLAVEGNYLQLLSSNLSAGGVLTIKTEGGDYVQCGDGDEIFLKPFKRLNLSHSMVVDLKIKVAISNEGERYRSNRVFGVVETVNGGLDRVLSGGAFIGFGSVSASAGNYSAVQLVNPAGSGVDLVVSSVSVVGSVAGIYAVGLYDVLLSSDISAAYYLRNKMAGGVGSVAKFRAENPSALIPGISFMNVGIDVGGSSKEFDFDEPIVLASGKGVVVQSAVVNSSIWANFQLIQIGNDV